MAMTGLARTGVDSDGTKTVVYGTLDASNNVITNAGSVYINDGYGLRIGGVYMTSWPVYVSHSGDTNKLDFSKAEKVLVPISSTTNSAATVQQLNDLRDSLSSLILYGATNNNPIYSGYGSLYATPPASWSITTNLVAGTNVIGIFLMTNYINRTRGGSYNGNFFAQKVSGSSVVRAEMDLIYFDDVPAYNVIKSSTFSSAIIAGIAPYWLNVYASEDILGTNLVMGVCFKLVRSSGSAALVTLYGGEGYNTHLATPGVGVVPGYATTEELTELRTEVYSRPLDALFYYGWLNSFNSYTNVWNNEKVAQDMAKYNLIVFGDGIAATNHGDYANTAIIIPRIKLLNPRATIFGYVAGSQALNTFETKVLEWEALAVNGIFIDASGYDYALTRSNFNIRIDYIHSMTNATIAFANSWNMDHILGTNNDPLYPNTNWNPTLAESSLTPGTDWVLIESFGVNTTAWPTNDGYEAVSDWFARGSKFAGLRTEYDMDFCGLIIISNDVAAAQDLFNFGFVSALMWSLDGFGSSDTSHGASSAQVNFLNRLDTSNMGITWITHPDPLVDLNDSDVYIRYLGTAKLRLDFSTGEHTNSIVKW